MPARAAQNRVLLEFISRPNNCPMSGKLGVTFVARKPTSAAFKFQRDDVIRPVIMGAPRFRIDLDAMDLNAVNWACHDAPRSRGQLRTSTAPTIQHAIITMKPVLNDPVR